MQLVIYVANKQMNNYRFASPGNRATHRQQQQQQNKTEHTDVDQKHFHFSSTEIFHSINAVFV